MRKSEFIKKEKEELAQLLGPPGGINYSILAERSAQAAEEKLGVKWDPEPTNLPGKLRFVDDEEELKGTKVEAYIVDVDGGPHIAGIPKIWYIANDLYLEERKAGLRAMVAVWNAWGPRGTIREVATSLDRGRENNTALWNQILSKPWEQEP